MKHSDPGHLRQQILEQLYSLRREFRGEKTLSGDICLWPRQADNDA